MNGGGTGGVSVLLRDTGLGLVAAGCSPLHHLHLSQILCHTTHSLRSLHSVSYITAKLLSVLFIILLFCFLVLSRYFNLSKYSTLSDHWLIDWEHFQDKQVCSADTIYCLVPGSWSTPSQHSWHLQIVTEITTYHLHGCFGRSLWWHVSALVQYIFVLSLNTPPTNLKTTGYYVHITDPLRLVW